MNFNNTFSPIQIGSKRVKNRLVVPAMDSGTFDVEGRVRQMTLDYYGARAKGGYGLIILEIAAVEDIGVGMPNQMLAADDSYIEGMTELADTIRINGATSLVQLHHAGRETMSAMINETPRAVSPLPSPVYKENVKEYTTEEVYHLIDLYIQAAKRCHTAGFDGIEIHSAHGYMGFQFISPRTNKRIDEFGGDIYGRSLFLKLIIEGIRKECGDDFIISVRISTEEGRIGGIPENEALIFATLMEEYGADLLDISAGTYAAWDIIVPTSDMQQGWNHQATERIKKHVDIPVIGVGHYSDPLQIEGALARDEADLIATGRQSIADPDFPNKMQAGDTMGIVPCVACTQRCMSFNDPAELMDGDVAVSCMYNPQSNERADVQIYPATDKKKVVVVGAGPGGLMAAMTAAERGHEVVLFEKEPKIRAGGQLLIGSYPPYKQELTRVIRHYLHMCERYNVDMRFDTEANKEAIAAEKADAVILATGAIPVGLKVEGSSQDCVVQANDVLMGRVVVGERVLVIGGGIVGAETAEYCVDYSNHIELVEMLPAIVPDLYMTVRDRMLARFKQNEIAVHTDTKIMSITEDGAVCDCGGEEIIFSDYDTIILAVGSEEYQPFDSPDDLADEVYLIGDAKEVRSAVEAVYEGFRVAQKI